MEHDPQQSSRAGSEAFAHRDSRGDDLIEWKDLTVRSDIAADPEVWLRAVGIRDGVPVVTADAFRDYVENWMTGPGSVIEADGALIHDSYTERFIFPVVGMAGAVPVYAIESYGSFGV